MLKVKEGIKLEELEKYGFRNVCVMGEWWYEKEYIEGNYKEHITIWVKDRIVQVHAIGLLDTLYDLIIAGIVVKE